MKTIKLTLLTTAILLFVWLNAANADEPFTITIHNASQLAPGIITFDARTLTGGAGYIIDNTGAVLHTFPPYFDFKKAGPRYTAINAGSGLGLFFDYKFNLSSIPPIQATSSYLMDNHEFLATDAGEFWYLIYDQRSPNAAEIAAGVPMTATFVSTIIQAQDANRNLIFEWIDSEHLDITKALAPINTARVDFCHGNSLAFDYDGNILFSCRGYGLLKINRATGAVIWILAGNANQFAGFTDIAWQHDFRPLLLEKATNTAQRGIYGVFDNHQSRGLVLEINQMSMVVTNTKIITAGEPTASFATGSFEQLPNGNFFVCWGTNALWGQTQGSPRLSDLAVTEHNPAGEVLLEIRYPDEQLCYRARKFTPVQVYFFPVLWK